MENKKKKQTKQTDRRIRGVIAVLVILIGLVAGYGILQSGKISFGSVSGKDGLMIESLVTGDYTAEIREEDGEYLICLELPEDFDFGDAILNLKLAEGSSVSEESNCWKGELTGRPVVNLTVEDASLLIENGDESRYYRFQINII